MSGRKLTASPEEKEETGKILSDILFNGRDDEMTGNWLHDYLDKRAPGVEKILASEKDDSSDELPYEELPRTLVDMFGSEIFEGENGFELREKILEKIFENEEYRIIFNIFLASSSVKEKEVEDMKVKVSNDPREEAGGFLEMMKDRQKFPWRPGGVYARRFVGEFRLDDFFAGIRSDPKQKRIEEAIPRADIP